MLSKFLSFLIECILQQRIADLESRAAPPPSLPVGSDTIRKLRKERDDLKDAVSNFETELLQIQMNTKILAEDRDNFRLLYEQVYAAYLCLLGNNLLLRLVRNWVVQRSKLEHLAVLTQQYCVE